MNSFVSRCRKQLNLPKVTRLISVPDTSIFSSHRCPLDVFARKPQWWGTGQKYGLNEVPFFIFDWKRPSSNDGSGWNCHVLMDGLKYRNCSVICVQFYRETHQEMIPKKQQTLLWGMPRKINLVDTYKKQHLCHHGNSHPAFNTTPNQTLRLIQSFP